MNVVADNIGWFEGDGIDDLVEFIDDIDEDDEDISLLCIERREYKYVERIDLLNKWDDYEFYQRFRLEKYSVVTIWQKISGRLDQKVDRFNIYYYLKFDIFCNLS